MKQQDIIKKLEEKDVQSSYHRIRILEYLMKHRIHPTVDDIHKDLSIEIPTLSKTTVYNTLKVLVDKKIVSLITTEEDEARYDYSEERHLHFKCKNCGALYDIFHRCDVLKQEEIDGHLIEEHHIYFRGICKKCRNKGVK